MRSSWMLVVTLAGVALARPDIGLELRKSQGLSNSYGVPSASITGSSHLGYVSPSPTYGPPLPSYAPPSISYEGPLASYHPSPTFQTPLVSTAVPFYSGPGVSVSPTVTPIFYNPGFIGSQIANQQTFHQASHFTTSQQQAQVQKHVYFFEAPQEPEDVAAPVTYNQAPAKKNVKILFIKAPSYKVPVYPQALYPQEQDKTIVYVLVKKPDAQEPIVVEPPPPTQPSKPEVFFIKYKNQQEAEEKVQNTLNSHAESGVNVITNNLETAPITGDSLLSTGLPFVTTASPLGLVTVDGGFIGSSTYSPFGSSSYPSFGEGVSVTSNGIPDGHFVSSTEAPSIFSSTFGPPLQVANVHPTYSPQIIVSSTESPIVSSTYAPSIEANSIPDTFYGAPPKIQQIYGPPSKK